MSTFNIINNIAVSPWNDQFSLEDPSPQTTGGPDTPCRAVATSLCKSWSPSRGELVHYVQAVIASTRQHGAPLTVMYQAGNGGSRFYSLHPSMEAAKAAVLDDLYRLHFSKHQCDVGPCEKAVAQATNDLAPDLAFRKVDCRLD